MTKFIFERFPQEYIDLNQELYHPAHADLANQLAAQQSDDVDIKLSITASYFGIILDGEYLLEDRIKLCALLLNKLREKRTGILVNLIGDPML